MGIFYINRLIEKGPQGKAVLPEGDPDPTAGAHPLASVQDATRSAIGSKE
jgi:cytochrome d ubiquinol oxidase subunit I